MVSTELLRRYPFFGNFDDDELKAIAMLADEVTVEGETTLFDSGQPAEYLYLLMEGEIEWHYDAIDPAHRERSRDFLIEYFSPGEPLGVSAVLEPHVYLGRADVRSRSRLLRMDGPRLRVLCELDTGMGPILMRQIVKVAVSRLARMRTWLAAARAQP
jgi:CRP-like cAMP-binding protein